ncbi:hypothetical protein TNCV_3934481 [Trichonephila clavipes]|nr:hypothetical protein TNCV_3934481 [Trichonephila clavipes]
MPMLKIIRQVGNPNAACVARTELTTMCFVSHNVANTVAIVHYCKVPFKNIATIAWTGIVGWEERCCLLRSLINNQRNCFLNFQEFTRTAGLSKSKKFINEVMEDAVSVMNLMEVERQERILRNKEQTNRTI